MRRLGVLFLSLLLCSCIGDPSQLGSNAGEPDVGSPDADPGEPDADAGEPDAGEPDADPGEPDVGRPDADAGPGVPCNDEENPFGNGEFQPTGLNSICSEAHLQALGSDLAYLEGHFILDSDLTLEVSSNQIGNVANPFIGTFDGRGYRIGNFNPPDSDTGGLFGAIGAGATITDLVLANPEVNGADAAGALVGVMLGGEIWEVKVAGGQVNPGAPNANDVGGLVGRMEGGVIRDADVTAVVQGSTGIGGLVGTMNGGEISDSRAQGSVSGAHKVGGLAGFASGVIRRSYVTGRSNQQASSVEVSFPEVDIVPFAGGLVGHCAMCEIHESSAEDVDASVSVTIGDSAFLIGGLVGVLEGDAEIKNSYVRRGELTGLVGGYVGYLVGETMLQPAIATSYSTATGSLISGGELPAFSPLETCLIGKGTLVPEDSYFPGVEEDLDRCGEEATDRFDHIDTFQFWSSSFWNFDNIESGQGPDHVYRLD